MAKRGRRANLNVAQIAEQKLVDFAEDLGRTLGTARSKAEGWLAQRSQIAKTLEEIRHTASSLLTQLTGGNSGQGRSGRRQRQSTAKPGGRGKTARSGKSAGRTKRRPLSAAGRERIAAAQRKRWAAVRRKKAAANA